MFKSLWDGLSLLGSGSAIAYLFAGALIGMIVGAIPGLSTVVILSIILAFSYHLSLTATLCLFLGAQAGSFYSASISAILLNTPGHPEAMPITFDGYPMARKGGAGRALGLSACSTCIGGLIGCVLLFGFLQVVNKLPSLFQPPEYLALVTLAILLVGTLGTDSALKAIAAAGAGLMIASIGPSAITGTFRFTFGSLGLYGGVSLVAMALGSFAIPQMVMVFGTGTAVPLQDMTGKEIEPSEEVVLTSGYGRQLIGGVFETFRHWVTLLASGLIGGLTGMIPGIGGFTGNFLAYGIARDTSRKERKTLFGTGIPEGIIAPEGSSLAKEAGHMIPLLGLGIPGGVAGALFISVLAIKNIKPGYGFTSTYPGLGDEILWILAFGGVIGTVAGVFIGPRIARVTRIPGPLLVPFIFALSASGPFLTDGIFFSVVEVLAFGVVGLGLRRLRYPLGSFILCLVLGPIFETNLHLTHVLYPGVSFTYREPIADVIFFVAILALVVKALEVRRNKRRITTSDGLAANAVPLAMSGAVSAQTRPSVTYPLLSLVMSIFLLGISLFCIIYGVSHYDFTTYSMPVIGAVLLGVPVLIMLPRDVLGYVRHWRSKRAAGAVHDPRWAANGQFRREVTALIWLFALVGLCWLFGFVWASGLFMVAYTFTSLRRYLHTRRSLVIFAVISTASMSAITYEMFNLLHLTFAPAVSL